MFGRKSRSASQKAGPVSMAVPQVDEGKPASVHLSQTADADGRKDASSRAQGISPLSTLTKLELPKHLSKQITRHDIDIEMEMAVSPSARLLFARAADENAWVCGDNMAGQLGLGADGEAQDKPHLIPGPVRWVALAQGDGHAAGVDDSGLLYAWGRLGLASKGEISSDSGRARSGSSSPTLLPLEETLDKVTGLSCGADHTVAVTETRVYAWGSASDGQCGSSPEEGSWIPQPRMISYLTGKYVTQMAVTQGECCRQVACGRSHSLCVTATSQVFAWGGNNHGQLGLGNTTPSHVPKLVEGLWAIPVRQLAAGDSHSAALTCNGFLFTWGRNSSGQLGHPGELESFDKAPEKKGRTFPSANQTMLDAMLDMGIPKTRAELALRETGNSGVEVAAEWLFTHTEELEDEEDLAATEGTAGKLAVPDGTASRSKRSAAPPTALAPRRVPLQGVSFVACGAEHTVAITEAGPMSWGSGRLGQLGLGSRRSQSDPMPVKLPEGLAAVQWVACGSNHSLFLTAGGQVLACGDNTYGQLGMARTWDGDPVVDTPQQVTFSFNKKQGQPLPVVVRICAGTCLSAFLLGLQSEAMSKPQPQPQLQDRLQSALDDALRVNKDKVSELSSQIPESGPQAGLHPHISLFHLLTAVKMVFSSAAAISAVFGLPTQVGVNVELLEDVQSKLVGMGSDLVNASLYKSTLYLLDDIYHKMHLLGTAERVQVLLAASQSPLLGEPKFAAHLLPRLCTVILSASSRHSSCRRMLQKWWAEYPASILLPRLVQPLQAYLTSELMKLKKLTVNVMNCIKLLDEIFRSNLIGRKLKAEDFHNELISEKLDVLDHYIAWRQSRDNPSTGPSVDGPFSFCSYPFLLNCKAKSKLLHTEAKIRMETTVAQARMESNNRRTNLGRSQDDERVLPVGKAHLTRLTSDNNRDRRSSRTSRSPSNPTGNSGVMRGFFGLLLGHGESSGSGSASAGEGPSSSRAPSSTGDGSSTLTSDGGVSTNIEAARRQVASDIHRSTSYQLVRYHSLMLPTPDRCGVPERHQDHCILRVRRSHILVDALEEIARQRTKDLLKPLRVHFIGEEGIDAGGVRKEFFQLLVNDLLRPDYGMLQFMEETRVFWFNPNTLEAEEEFMLIGIIMGLAIYNAVLLDLPLPQVLYKKLLKQEVGLRDLEEMQPTLGRSLKQLLKYEGPGSVEDVFCQTFSVDLEAFGHVNSVELKPGGQDISVTEENRREFVEIYAEYILCESVKTQFEAFSRGFLMVCGGPALNLFHAQELETLVCGEENLDFNALRKNARYDGGYNAESQQVVWLWEILLELTEDERHQFLKFYTGSDRAPIGGLGSMRSIIQRDGTDSGKLPTSHTCFNTLLLPEYSSREKMGSMLRLAILNAEGFGLE